MEEGRGVVGLETVVRTATVQHEELAALDFPRRRGTVVQYEGCNSARGVRVRNYD